MEESAAELLAAVTAQYYLPRAILPHEILLCVDTGDCEELSEALTQRAGHKVWVHVPQRGEKSTLADMAVRNAQEEVRRATTAEEKTAYTLEALQKMLNLPQPPRRMESFDISNTGASDIVASMVVYQGTKPLKSAYRRFQIKELTSGHPDDYASMREVLRRRLQRAADGDEKFLPLPDVFLIDGGVTHADAVREVAEQFGCTVPIFGMVKAQKIEPLFNGGGQTARIGLRDMSKNHDLSPYNAWILAHTLSSTVIPLRRFSASRVVNSWPGKRMAWFSSARSAVVT